MPDRGTKRKRSQSPPSPSSATPAEPSLTQLPTPAHGSPRTASPKLGSATDADLQNPDLSYPCLNACRANRADRLSKRLPERPPARKTDLYFTRASRPAGLRARARGLLGKETVRRVTLHAMGAAVTPCCDLALELQREAGVGLDVRTSTVEVVDDYIPLKPGLPFVTRSRFKSAIHIGLVKPA